MPEKHRRYRDIDLNFDAHPKTQDVTTKSDEEAVKRAIRYLVQTNHYERPFNPDLGSGVYDMLFEPMGHLTAVQLERMVADVINTYEPRAELIDVVAVADVDNNKYEITVKFRVVNNERPVEFTMSLERLR